MKLLAIGGPKHGEYLPYEEGRLTLFVPIMPDLKAVYGAPYCVHGGEVRSATDGDVHHVPALRVAELYRLHRSEYKLADPYFRHNQPFLTGAQAKRCLYPDPTGRYQRPDMLDSLTVTSAEYNRRLIADRAVWVWVA